MPPRKNTHPLEKALTKFKQHYKPNELKPDFLIEDIERFYYDAILERKNIADETIDEEQMLNVLSAGNLSYIKKLCFNYHLPKPEMILCLQTLLDLGVTSAYLFLGKIYFNESRDTYLSIAAYYCRKAYDSGYTNKKLDPFKRLPLGYYRLNPYYTLAEINDWFSLHSWNDLYRAMYHVSLTIAPTRLETYLIDTDEFLQQLQSEENEKIPVVLSSIENNEKVQTYLQNQPGNRYNSFATQCMRNHFIIYNMLTIKFLSSELINLIYLFVANDAFKLSENKIAKFQSHFFRNRASYQAADLPNSIFNDNNKIYPGYF